MGEGGGHINEVRPSGDGRTLVWFSWWRPGAMGAFWTFLEFNPHQMNPFLLYYPKMLINILNWITSRINGNATEIPTPAPITYVWREARKSRAQKLSICAI